MDSEYERASREWPGIKFLFSDRVGPWHQKFAWFPIKTHDVGWVWLRKVWRAKYQTKTHLNCGLDQFWVYVIGPSA